MSYYNYKERRRPRSRSRTTDLPQPSTADKIAAVAPAKLSDSAATVATAAATTAATTAATNIGTTKTHFLTPGDSRAVEEEEEEALEADHTTKVEAIEEEAADTRRTKIE